METNRIILGDCLESLKTLPDESVDCCVTSPPYYALRDYGTGHWEGGNPNCPHYRTSKASDKTATGHKRMQEFGSPVGDAIYKDVCPLCGAVRVDKQIGLEETPEAYISKLTEVFEEVRRVLKKDGTLWLNIGDSYNGYKGNANSEYNDSEFVGGHGNHPTRESGYGLECKGLKPKDLIGIPWMLAFSLRSAGWYLRQDIIWHKPNPMPESVTDRCTKSHEYIFLLSKSQRYYFNHEAIQEEANYDGRKDLMMHGSQKYADAEIMPDAKPNTMAQNGHQRWQTKTSIKFGGNKYGQNEDGHFQTYSGKEWKPQTKNCQYDGQEPNSMHLHREEGLPDKVYFVRNKRDVWSINLKPTKEAHFATYPMKLVQPCILAGCREGGIVLDPFMGSGTTGIVARILGRKYIGCELNPEYKAMAERRIQELGENLFSDITDD